MKISIYERIPRFRRVAYYDVVYGCAHVYPIGIHLLVMLFRRFYELTYFYNPSKLERLLVKQRHLIIEEVTKEKNDKLIELLLRSRDENCFR